MTVFFTSICIFIDADAFGSPLYMFFIATSWLIFLFNLLSCVSSYRYVSYVALYLSETLCIRLSLDMIVPFSTVTGTWSHRGRRNFVNASTEEGERTQRFSRYLRIWL